MNWCQFFSNFAKIAFLNLKHSFLSTTFSLTPIISSGVYIICKSIVNYLRNGKLHMQIRSNLPDIQTSYCDSSGFYICKSIVNDLRHGNYICNTLAMSLIRSNGWRYTVRPEDWPDSKRHKIGRECKNSSGVYICKSIVNDLKTWKISYVNQKKMYLIADGIRKDGNARMASWKANSHHITSREAVATGGGYGVQAL